MQCKYERGKQSLSKRREERETERERGGRERETHTERARERESRERSTKLAYLDSYIIGSGALVA